MPKQKMLEDLFLETLKDIYYAERQIVKALPKMAKAAGSDELRTAFENHLEETHGQIDRLQQVVVTLLDPTRMQLVASVRESLSRRLAVGGTVSVRVDVLDHPCSGTVSEIVPGSRGMLHASVRWGSAASNARRSTSQT